MQLQRQARLETVMGTSVRARMRTSALQGMPTVCYIQQSASRSKFHHRVFSYWYTLRPEVKAERVANICLDVRNFRTVSPTRRSHAAARQNIRTGIGNPRVGVPSSSRCPAGQVHAPAHRLRHRAERDARPRGHAVQPVAGEGKPIVPTCPPRCDPGGSNHMQPIPGPTT